MKGFFDKSEFSASYRDISERRNQATAFIGGAGGVHYRADNDFYATPPLATRALLNVLELKGSILEPACGMGHISEVLKEYYPNSEIVSTDLIYRGYGIGGIDFLTYDFGRKFGNIITNPPYSLAIEFVKRGLDLANDKVIMLLRIQFLESRSRKNFLVNSPLRYVYVFSERPSPMKNGLELNPRTGKPWNSPMMLAWFVWEICYKGEPIIRWL